MKFIGAFEGEYEGNKYARVICVEPFTSKNGHGENAVVSKINYNYFVEKILPDIDLYLGAEVGLSYDRFGKVQTVTLI